MDVNALEAEAKATAIKHIVTMLQVPEQLEKVQQYKKRVSRKKASIDAMLKTALQSQLDGFRTALNLQKSIPDDLLEIQHNLNEDVQEIFKSLPGLTERLQEVKEESIRHSQYGAAIENLKHIFNVPGSVQKTQELIANDKLLHAHQALSELENSRDDLLYELHKLPSQSVTDRNMLKQYFADVEKLSDDLGKQIWLVLKRTLNSVRKEPQVVVTALRIIEREERRDQAALERQKSSGGFLPPSRPKQWRKRCFEVLESATVCAPCFPPEYDIFNRYVRMYHSCLSRHLQSIIANELEGNEYITVLGWLTVYTSEELMGHPDLALETHSLEPLLGRQDVQQLIDKYLGTLVANYQDWLRNALQSDVKDWHRECEPDMDSRGCYHTSAPMIVFQMVDQHLQVAKTVGPDLVTEFRDRHFEDRSVREYFTHYVIAVANNCLQFQQLFEKSYSDCCSGQGALAKGDNEVSQQSLERLQERTLDTLRDELFLDLNKELMDVMTRKWLLTGSNIIDTVSATVEDYFRDYARLLPKNLETLAVKVQWALARSYVHAILQRKITFKGYEERKDAAEKINRESDKLAELFRKATPPSAASSRRGGSMSSSHGSSPLDALPLLAEVLKMKDTSLLSLESVFSEIVLT
ncbi:hypothetical protein MRX96_024627 [Rhipicephalus microplus]